MGFDALGFHAMGEWIMGANPPLVYLPISKIGSSGSFNPNPIPVVAV